jgi:hypothetical protein
MQDNLLQSVADTPVTFRSPWLRSKGPATIQQIAAAKGEYEDFGNFSYETQTEGLFVAFAIKIPNAFTDFDL